jgi:hypothetical protein
MYYRNPIKNYVHSSDPWHGLQLEILSVILSVNKVCITNSSCIVRQQTTYLI